MSVAYKHFVRELKRLEPKQKNVHYGDSYTGSGHFYYGVSVPNRRALLKDWLKANKEVGTKEIIALADHFFRGKSHEEKTMGGYLLAYAPEARAEVTTRQLNAWLGELSGWAEIDSLCQNIWQADELLANWNGWKKLLLRLAQDKNINKRRASLVLLVGPCWKSDEEKLHQLAYQNIDTLKEEKDILITKAISWLLRSMSDTRPNEVAAYLKQQADALPAIAVRETKKKLLTGRKNS